LNKWLCWFGLNGISERFFMPTRTAGETGLYRILSQVILKRRTKGLTGRGFLIRLLDFLLTKEKRSGLKQTGIAFSAGQGIARRL